MENITTSIRLIQAVDGETENDQYLNSKYGKLPPDEALAYANTLTWLKHDLEETGVPRAARAALGLPAEGAVPMEQRTKVLAKLQADRHRHKLKNIRITKAKKSLSIERTNETF